nr:polysaccharide pyruvyl transferase family protein [uncultured Blautia sp.]
MKIGIVTVQYANNFGAVLQAYGLKIVLEQMGHQVFYIRSCTDKYARGLFYRIRPYGKEYRHLLSFIIKNYRGWKQHYTFQSVKKIFPVIDYWSDEELDLIILGSDEIWNVRNPLFKQPVFYGYGMNPVMTYAVSIGNASYTDMQTIPMKYFQTINPVLVRDTMTQDYLKSIGINSDRVCDPTLLVDTEVFYRTYRHRLMKKPYLLVYAYGHLETENVKKTIRDFAEKRGLRVISVCFHLDWCDGTINCSPLDFSAVMEQAEYVYTSTLHGTIFSIINHKSFVSFPYSVKTVDLLQSLHLSNRIVSLDNCTEQTLEQKLIYEHIDYNSVDIEIEKQRKQSKKLLAKGIDKAIERKKNASQRKFPILVPEKACCCGCSACYAICPFQAIHMEEDVEGFLYPIIIKERCICCYKCLEVCDLKKNKRG